MYDSSGPHDGTLCGPSPANYSWGTHGDPKQEVPDSGTDEITGWGTTQWRTCGGSTPNTGYQTRNLKVMVLRTSGWFVYGGSGFHWCQVRDPDTSNGGGDCSGPMANWIAPVGQKSLHWATFRQPFMSGTRCAVVTYEARKTGSGQLMSNAGFDWITDSEIDGDAFFGRYVLLTASYETIGGSSCTSAQLNANPPPL